MACDAPGLKKEDIDIQFEDNILTVKAARKEEAREEVSVVFILLRTQAPSLSIWRCLLLLHVLANSSQSTRKSYGLRLPCALSSPPT